MSIGKNNIPSLTPMEETFLEKLIANGITEIIPTEEIDHLEFQGMIQLEADYSDQDLLRLLKTLTKKGFLKVNEYDRAIICPNCGSKYVHTKYNCPKCNSYHTIKRELIEHPHCGFIGEKRKFEKDDKLICPNCKATLTILNSSDPTNRKTYRIIGTTYECEKCGNKYQRPNFTHICIKCNTKFGYQKAQYKKLFTFTTTEKLSEIDPEKVVEAISDKLTKIIEEQGFKVQTNSALKGQSGVTHKFGLTALNGSSVLVADVIHGGTETDLITLLGKKIDVQADLCILACTSSEISVPKLEKAHNLLVAQTNKEFETSIREYLTLNS